MFLQSTSTSQILAIVLCVSFVFCHTQVVEQWENFVWDILNISTKHPSKLHGTLWILCQTSLCISPSLLQRLHVPWTFYTNTKNFMVSVRDHVIVVCKTVQEAVRIPKYYKNGPGCNFIVVLEDPSDILLIGNVTRTFLDNDMINLMVIIVEENQQFQVYTLDPFRDPEHCFDSSPIISDKISLLEEQILHYKVFRNNLFRNFHGCKFRVSTFAGYGIGAEETNGAWKITGNAAEILETVSRKMNFTSEVVPVEGDDLWGYAVENGTSPGLRGAVYQNDVDFGFQLFFHQDLDIYSYDDDLKTFCLGVCVPEINIPITFWWPLTSEFSTGLWLLLFGTLVFVCCTLKLLAFFSHSEKIRNPTVVVIGQILSSGAARPISIPGRLFFAHFFVFCIVMTTAYRATQKSKFVAPEPLKGIETFEELVSSPMKIALFESDKSNIENFPPELKSKYYVLADSEFKVSFYQSMVRGETSMLSTSYECASYPEMRENHTLILRTYMIPGYCVRMMYSHFFVFRKHSPLAATLAKATTRLLHNGVMDKHIFGSILNRSGTKVLLDHSQVFGMENLCPALIMLIVGLSIGGIVYILEVLIKRT